MIEAKITEMLIDILDAKGFAIVKVAFKKNTLQILIEKSSGERVSIDDCTKVSRLVSRVLDVEELISTNYTLEVSSPGLDRPLICRKDYERFAGKKAKIILKEKVLDFKKVKGVILALDEDFVIIKIDEQEHRIHINNILSATLIPEIKFN